MEQVDGGIERERHQQQRLKINKYKKYEINNNQICINFNVAYVCSADTKEPLLHLEVKTYNLITNFIFNLFL